MTVVRIWRILTAIAFVIFLAGMILLTIVWVRGLLNGDVISDSSMIVYFQEGPSFTYRDFYAGILRYDLILALWTVSSGISFTYQNKVLKTGNFGADGDRKHMIAVIALNIVSLITFILIL